MNKLVMASLLCFGMIVHANGKEATNPEAIAVNNACTKEAATAGCTGEKVGTGLLKCFAAYRKAHKGQKFEVSPECESALKAERAHNKEKRAAKAAAPAAGAPATTEGH